MDGVDLVRQEALLEDSWQRLEAVPDVEQRVWCLMLMVTRYAGKGTEACLLKAVVSLVVGQLEVRRLQAEAHAQPDA